MPRNPVKGLLKFNNEGVGPTFLVAVFSGEPGRLVALRVMESSEGLVFCFRGPDLIPVRSRLSERCLPYLPSWGDDIDFAPIFFILVGASID